MAQLHLVRWGALGQVGRFTSVDATLYPRGTDVVCRTSRGLEIGQVLNHARPQASLAAEGRLLRAMTDADRMLAERLHRHRHQALDACQRLLDDRGLNATLMDVEHLFDGQSLYFYFLGETPRELESLTSELASAYDAKVQFQQFARSLSEGCGPDCGSEEAAGQGCGSGCQSCAVMDACHSKRGS